MIGGKDAEWVDENMADVLVARAKDLIKQNASKPFFLYFSSHDIHVPRMPHPRFVGATQQGPRSLDQVGRPSTVT